MDFSFLTHCANVKSEWCKDNLNLKDCDTVADGFMVCIGRQIEIESGEVLKKKNLSDN